MNLLRHKPLSGVDGKGHRPPSAPEHQDHEGESPRLVGASTAIESVGRGSLTAKDYTEDEPSSSTAPNTRLPQSFDEQVVREFLESAKGDVNLKAFTAFLAKDRLGVIPHQVEGIWKRGIKPQADALYAAFSDTHQARTEPGFVAFLAKQHPEFLHAADDLWEAATNYPGSEIRMGRGTDARSMSLNVVPLQSPEGGVRIMVGPSTDPVSGLFRSGHSFADVNPNGDSHQGRELALLLRNSPELRDALLVVSESVKAGRLKGMEGTAELLVVEKALAKVGIGGKPSFEFVEGIDLTGPYAFQAMEVDEKWQVFRVEEVPGMDMRRTAILGALVAKADARQLAADLNTGIDAHYSGHVPDGVRKMLHEIEGMDAHVDGREKAWSEFEPSEASRRLVGILDNGRWNSEHQLWKAYLGFDTTPSCAANGATTPEQDRQWAIYKQFSSELRLKAESKNVGDNIYIWRKK